MSEYEDWQDGLEVAAKTRTISDLVNLLVEVCMTDAEVMDTVRRIAEQTLFEERPRKAHLNNESLYGSF